MKNLKKIILLITISYSTLSFGQEFAPIGAQWHYTETFAWSGDIDYLLIESVKDTTIQSKLCKQLDCGGVCWNPSGTQFIYYSNDSLYHFNSDLDTFQLISAFNSDVGDSWDIHVKDWDQSIDTITVHVDSLSSLLINEKQLKVLHVSYHLRDNNLEGAIIQDYWYNSQIIEKIGDIEYFFNFPVQTGLMCDMNYSSGLRCYEDSELGLYSTGIAGSCTYRYDWTEIDNTIIDFAIEVYPNPTSGWIEIKSTIITEITVTVFDISGSKVFTSNISTNSKIDLSNLQKGLYFMQLMDSEKILRFSKIIKN